MIGSRKSNGHNAGPSPCPAEACQPGATPFAYDFFNRNTQRLKSAVSPSPPPNLPLSIATATRCFRFDDLAAYRKWKGKPVDSFQLRCLIRASRHCSPFLPSAWAKSHESLIPDRCISTRHILEVEFPVCPINSSTSHFLLVTHPSFAALFLSGFQTLPATPRTFPARRSLRAIPGDHSLLTASPILTIGGSVIMSAKPKSRGSLLPAGDSSLRRRR